MSVEATTLELPCGCITEVINGLGITILCDMHEDEYQDMLNTPVHFKKTRMTESREI